MRELGLLILILALSPVVILGLHCFLHRLSRSIGFDMSGQQGAILSVLSANFLLLPAAWFSVLSHWRNDFLELMAGFVYLILVYLSIGFGYFSFLNLSETSLHVHILLKILAKGKVHLQELKSEYNPETMVKARIERMIQLRQIELKGGRCYSKNRFLVVGKSIFTVGRSLLGLPLKPES